MAADPACLQTPHGHMAAIPIKSSPSSLTTQMTGLSDREDREITISIQDTMQFATAM